MRDNIVALNGSLFLSTGDEYIMMDAKRVNYGKMTHDLTGVQIEVSFPTGA